MSEHRLEIADVFRDSGARFLKKYGQSLSFDQHRALRAIILCRTRVLGGHVQQCDRCGHVKHAYNSCRNRHCPKCQASARSAWLEARSTELLPVPYFHVVFTLPEQLGPIALQNKETVYGILFRAAWETLRDVARDSKHLGANLGMLAVLHTWGQNLMHHPHVHCVVPGGGLSLDGQRWVRIRKTRKRKLFFLPVRVLSRVFRGKFIQHLKAAYRNGKISPVGQLASLKDEAEFEKLVTSSVRNDWVVYCKRPFGGPEQVLKYLARYTHRVAISNNRLMAYENGKVRFRWKDYRHAGKAKVMELDGLEFMRRFLLHVVPTGFVRIRHYGFLSNRHRSENLERCRDLLGVTRSPPLNVDDHDSPDADRDLPEETMTRCPACSNGRMQTSGTCAPIRGLSTRAIVSLLAFRPDYFDSS